MEAYPGVHPSLKPLPQRGSLKKCPGRHSRFAAAMELAGACLEDPLGGFGLYGGLRLSVRYSLRSGIFMHEPCNPHHQSNIDLELGQFLPRINLETFICRRSRSIHACTQNNPFAAHRCSSCKWPAARLQDNPRPMRSHTHSATSSHQALGSHALTDPYPRMPMAAKHLWVDGPQAHAWST